MARNKTKPSKQEIKRRIDRMTAARLKQKAERYAKGVYPVEYMRLCLSDRSYAASKRMTRREFCDFASAAIVKEAKRKGMSIPAV